MNVSYKNFPFHLIGCALFLLIGARTQSVKAVLPHPSVVEMHWRKNPKIFQQTFEVLSPKAEWLPFWSENFPDWFKKQNGNLCEVETASGDLSFHTLDDLEKLKCDAELKKIIKVLGSTEFLEKVLSKEVIKSIFDHATSGKEFRLEIEFRPYFKDAFFNPLNKGSLNMTIRSHHFSKEVMKCRLVFDFEKENSVMVLKNFRVSYDVGDNRKTMEFFKKTNKLSHFPWNAVRKAQRNFSSVYAKLRNDLMEGRRLYEYCIDPTVKRAGIFCLDKEFDIIAKESKCKALMWKNPTGKMLDILATKDFLNGIFEEKFWNILAYSNMGCDSSCLRAEFRIQKFAGGLKVSFLLDSRHIGNMKEDALRFKDERLNWEWLILNHIKFVFFFDPSKDEISHVRLQDELVLNYETIQKGETENFLLHVDHEDVYRPDSFWFEVYAPSLLKWHRHLTKNRKVKFEVIENDILKICYRFEKDPKGFAETLSRWALGKNKRVANAHKKNSDNNKQKIKGDTPTH